MKASRMILREQSEEDAPCGARSHTHGSQAIPVRDVQTVCSVIVGFTLFLHCRHQVASSTLQEVFDVRYE